MIWKWLVSIAAFGLGSATALYAAGPPLAGDGVAPVAVRATVVPLNARDAGQARVGALLWRGGVVLASDDRRFGGLSDLRFDPACGRLLAITDTGGWVALVPVERDGLMVGAEVPALAPIRDLEGRAPARKAEADAEALVALADGRTAVWFELDHRAQLYAAPSACDPATLAAPAADVIRVPEMRAWPANGGVEAAARLGDGQIVIAEGQPGPAVGRAGLVLDAAGQVVRRFSVPVPAGYDPTAMTPLDPGASAGPWLLLLRRFSPLSGVQAAVVMMTLPADGAVAEIRPLAAMRPPLNIDNMEGIAVRIEGGERMIYLVSDDNFNPAQRTLLLKFALDPTGLPPVRPSAAPASSGRPASGGGPSG